MVTLTVSEKKLSESCVDLNGELEKGAVGTLEALRTLGRKLQDINEASMRKVNFIVIIAEKENLVQLYNNGCKEARKLMKQFIDALELFGTLVTPISEHGIELEALKAPLPKS